MVPVVPGPQDLVFLTHLPLRALEAGGELPLLLYSLLSFHLGPIATRAARLPLAAPARLTAGLLQGAIVQSVGAAAANPTMLALQIPRLLKGASLPTTRDGRPYEDARVPLNQLRPLPSRQPTA